MRNWYVPLKINGKFEFHITVVRSYPFETLIPYEDKIYVYYTDSRQIII